MNTTAQFLSDASVGNYILKYSTYSYSQHLQYVAHPKAQDTLLSIKALFSWFLQKTNKVCLFKVLPPIPVQIIVPKPTSIRPQLGWPISIPRYMVTIRDAPICSAPIHIGRYSHYRFWSAFSKWPIKFGRSDDIKSARTMRDVSIAANRNGVNAPGEGRQSAEVHKGILTHRAASPSPELNLRGQLSRHSHVWAPKDWCSR